MSLFDSIRRVIRRRAVHREVAKLKALTVGEIMTTYVVTVKPHDEVVKAATKMIAEDISCLVVADEGRILGVLSERDFLKKVPLSKAVFTMKVKDIMTANPVTVPRSMKLPEAVALMKAKGFRRLIVAEDGKMLGIVTQTDFTKTISKIFTSFPSIAELTCGHVMTKKVLTVTPKETVAQAKQKMLKVDCGAIIIVDKVSNPEPLGIFTEYDIVMQFYDQHGKLEMRDISHFMRKYVRATAATTSLFEANRLMLSKNMRRLLIVDDKKIIGIVTQTDICRYLYGVLDVIDKAADKPDIFLDRFYLSTEIHGEFKSEHLKVYTLD
jgi:CBS domain-containing protein